MNDMEKKLSAVRDGLSGEDVIHTVTPFTVETAVKVMVLAGEAGIGLDSPEALFAHIGDASGELMGHLFLQWLGDRAKENHHGEWFLTERGKMAAVQFAEVLGPDWGQAMYQFTRLVTKVA